MLSSFKNDLQICVVGASGGIGRCLLKKLDNDQSVKSIYTFSRKEISPISNKVKPFHIDITSEDSVKKASSHITNQSIDLIVVATGILHDDGIVPEKRISDLNSMNMRKLYEVNTIGPAMIAKYFIPLLDSTEKSVFAVLSARVGSIKDNSLGGWTSYRASKAALNMIIKTISIETARTIPNAIIVGLHPGTVDTNLSKPFQKNISKEKLFSPNYTVEKLLSVINNLEAKDSGGFFAWDGKQIDY